MTDWHRLETGESVAEHPRYLWRVQALHRHCGPPVRSGV